MRKLSVEELERPTLEEFRDQEKFPLIIALDNIRSMHNVGSVFRTADAFNIRHLLLGGYTPQPPHRDIHKTALGATESVEWSHHTDLYAALQNLKNMGYRIVFVEQMEGSQPLDAVQWPTEPVCLVFGNEAFGIAENLIPLADEAVEIPQWGTKHSLNISVAVGVVLWDYVMKNKLIS